MSRKASFTDTHRTSNAHYADWELKFQDGTDVSDRGKNFLEWCEEALKKAGFGDMTTEIGKLLKDHKFTCCFQLHEAAQNLPLKDWDPKVKTFLIGPLNYLIKEVNTEVQIITGAPSAETNSKNNSGGIDSGSAMLALAHIQAQSNGMDLEKVKGVPHLLEYQAQRRLLKVQHQQTVLAKKQEFTLVKLNPEATPSFHLQGKFDLQTRTKETHYYIPLKDCTLWNYEDSKDQVDLTKMGLANYMEKHDALFRLFLIMAPWNWSIARTRGLRLSRSTASTAGRSGWTTSSLS